MESTGRGSSDLYIGAAGIRAERFARDRRRRFRDGPDSRVSQGEELQAEAATTLTSRLGFDVSQARIHTGPEADEAARALDAEAFTVGRDIYFSAGRFDPASSRGTRLLAHELVHVRQQTGNREGPMAARQPAGAGESGGANADRLIQPGAQAAAPSMAFAMRAPQPTMATPPPPSETASKGGGGASGADTRAVADRVYELMKQEFKLGRQRGVIAKRRRWR